MMQIAPSRTYDTTPGTSPGLVVAGFDPSIASAGLCLLERMPQGYRKLHHQVIRTSSADPTPVRVGALSDALATALAKFKPACLVVEEQLGVQTGKRQREEGYNADSSKTVGSAYAAMAVARIYRVPVVEVHPKTAKVAVLGKGGGRADKHQIQRVIASILGERIPQDASDAATMAIYGFQLSPSERRGS